MSTAFGMTVTLSAGMPRATMSPRRPSQMVKTWSACCMARVSSAAGEAVAQAAFGGGAVVDRGVFPEGADLIDHRDAQLAGDLDGREGIEHRRMGMDDVRANFPRDFFQAGFELLHQAPVRLTTGQAGQAPSGDRGAVEVQAIDVFERRCGFALLGRGEVKGLPAQRALLAQERRGAEGVAAVQRNRVVEDVEDRGSCRAPRLAP